jgi:hypothetical protein
MSDIEVKNVLASYLMAQHEPKQLLTFIAQMEASLSGKDVKEVHDRVELWKQELKRP